MCIANKRVADGLSGENSFLPYTVTQKTFEEGPNNHDMNYNGEVVEVE